MILNVSSAPAHNFICPASHQWTDTALKGAGLVSQAQGFFGGFQTRDNGVIISCCASIWYFLFFTGLITWVAPPGKVGLQPIDVWKEKYVGSQTLTTCKVMYFQHYLYDHFQIRFWVAWRGKTSEARKAVLGKSAWICNSLGSVHVFLAVWFWTDWWYAVDFYFFTAL